MSDTTTARDWIERHLRPTGWRDDEADLQCPLPEHRDANPSATANAIESVWYCHGCKDGGTLTELARRLEIEPPAHLGNDTFRNLAEAVYQYRNVSGDLVFEVVRKTASGGIKTFRQRHQPTPDGRYVWKAPPDGRGLIYRLPEVLVAVRKARQVLIVEGEKDADRLAELDFTATCNAGGAEKWTRNHAKYLPPGSRVYVLPDCDVPGIAHRDKVCHSLLAQGCEVYAVAPQDFGYKIEEKHGKDVSDWLEDDSSRGRAEVTALLKGALKLEPATKVQQATSQSLPAQSADDSRPQIRCARGRRDEWTREAVKVLVAAGPRNERQSLYGSVRLTPGTGTNSGHLVSLVAAEAPEPHAWLSTPKGMLQIRPVSIRTVCRQLDREARWFVERRDRYGARNFEPSNSTPDDAEHVLETYKDDLLDEVKRPRMRTLRGVVDAPTLRRDGTIIDRPGYDDVTWLYANFDSADWGNLPVNPTREDARAALQKLYDLVDETPFADRMHRAVWVALVLTLVGRFYAAGNVPLFAFTANAPGVGKGTLVDLAGIIATGRPVPKWAPVSGRKTDAEGEERKRLVAVGLDGILCVCIDNQKAGEPLGTPAMDAAITCGTDYQLGTIGDRKLGQSATIEVPWSCVLTATGNNLVVVGDMARRTLLCRLETNNSDPETRVYRRHPKVADYCIKHRVELLMAALTVLVAHRDAVARDETKPLPSIGSFGGWSDRIRSAVAWADPDGCDPWSSNAEVKADAQPEQTELLALLGALHSKYGTREVVVKEVELSCREGTKDYSVDLAEAVANIALPAPRGNDSVNTRALGRWLVAHKERPGPYRLHEGRRYSGKPTRWYVEKIEAPGASTVAKQAIEDLLDVFPDLPNVQREQIRQELWQMILLPKQIEAIDQVYGEDLEQAIKGAFPVVKGPDGNPLPQPSDEYRKKGYTAQQAAKMQDVEAVQSLAMVAEMVLEATRPNSPAFQEVLSRYHALPVAVSSRECRALNYLKLADKALGVDANAVELAAEAARFVKADAVKLISGEEAKMVYSDQSIGHDEARNFEAEVEAGIKELCGIG